MQPQLRLLLLVDHSLDVIELLGSHGVIQGVSSAIQALAGYAPADVVGRGYKEFIHPDDLAVVERAFTEVLQLGRAGPLTLRSRCSDGSWRTLQATARDLRDDPAAHAILVMTRDVTAQVRAEALLEQANSELRRLSQLLMVAQERERAHLARELHDDVAQVLVGLSLAMTAHSGSSDARISADDLDTWRRLLRECLDKIRAIALNLRPPALDRQGLPEALKALLARIHEVVATEIELDVAPGLGRFAPEVELAAFRIVQEALTNAIKYSGGARVKVRVHQDAGVLSVTVRDDGRGFDVPAVMENCAYKPSVGLLSMRERAGLVGGNLSVTSSPGHGTEVCARLPLAAP